MQTIHFFYLVPLTNIPVNLTQLMKFYVFMIICLRWHILYKPLTQFRVVEFWVYQINHLVFWLGLWFICQYCVIPGSFSVWYNIHIIIFKSSIYQFIFIQLSYAKMCEKQFRSFINFYFHKTLQDVLGWILPLIFDEDKQLPTNNVP